MDDETVIEFNEGLDPASMLAFVDQSLERIDSVKHDDEVAHSREDDLRDQVLYWISLNSVDKNIRSIADRALDSSDIDFARWCA